MAFSRLWVHFYCVREYVTRADDNNRCDATNGKRNKQDKMLVMNYLSLWPVSEKLQGSIFSVPRERFEGPSKATSVTGGDDNIHLLPHLLTLDETYKHVLLAIDGEMRQYAQRLFQCPAVSIRPLGDVLALKALLRDIPKYIFRTLHCASCVIWVQIGQKLIARIGIGAELEDKRGEETIDASPALHLVSIFWMIESINDYKRKKWDKTWKKDTKYISKTTCLGYPLQFSVQLYVRLREWQLRPESSHLEVTSSPQAARCSSDIVHCATVRFAGMKIQGSDERIV